MNKILVTLFLMAISTAVEAAPARAQWTPPTTRENGTPLKPTEIVKYELRCVGLPPLQTSAVKFPKGNTSAYIIDLKPGTHSCLIRVHDTLGLTSIWSTPPATVTVK